MSEKHIDSTLLQQSWPPFLDWLHEDWCRAAEEFSEFAYRLLKTRPPRLLSSQTHDDQDDLIQRTIIHFVDDECRVLKSYQDKGRPFRDWFITVAQNKMMDIVRQAGKDSSRFVDSYEETAYPASPEPDPPSLVLREETIQAIARNLSRMKEKCRILVRAFYRGLNFREMATLLGLRPDQNKKASDDLSYCLEKLRSMLEDEGFARTDF